MKTTRRKFLGALAAFVFGVRATLLRETPSVAGIPTPPKTERICVGQMVALGQNGTVRPAQHGEMCIGVAMNSAESGEYVSVAFDFEQRHGLQIMVE